MTARKMNYITQTACLTENFSLEPCGRENSSVIHQIWESAILSGGVSILARAETAWAMLTAGEKDEYSMKADSLPVNAFDLFMYDYICLSGSELKAGMKELFQKMVTRH